MRRGVTVVPVSGLGNRMRVVTSVVHLATQTKLPIRIVWQPAWDCNARFDELFEPLQVENVTIEKGTFVDTPATKHNFLLPYLLRTFQYKHEERCYKPSSDVDFSELIKRYSSLYVDTCYTLAPYSPEMVKQVFIPLPVIKERIEDITSRFTARILGVHIRRSDNRKAIEHSPLSLFRKRIDSMLEQGETEQIFLCTDDDNVRKYLKETYGNRLITRTIELRRDTFSGIRDAVIDLWSLSKTTYILGSYYSSFSDTAAELGSVPFEMIYQ